MSNKIFYEIFEYLDGHEIYQSFSNLNHHFQQLFNCSSVLFKFKYHSLIPDKIYTNTFRQFLLNHKHQILSFYIQKNDFFSSFSIDSSFHRLQSLDIGKLPRTSLISLLTNLSSLSHLTSLTIDVEYTFIDISEVYRLIFILPKLNILNVQQKKTTHMLHYHLLMMDDSVLSNILLLIINVMLIHFVLYYLIHHNLIIYF